MNTVLERIRRETNRRAEGATHRRTRIGTRQSYRNQEEGSRQSYRNQEEETFRTNPQQDDQYVLLNFNIRVGDRVQILNPGPLQQDRGIVVGPARRRGFILIRTSNGDIILRIPRNVRILSNTTQQSNQYD